MGKHLNNCVKLNSSTAFDLFTIVLFMGILLPAGTSWGSTIDAKGNLVSHFPYKVKVNGKWGFIDKTGKIIIKLY